MNDLEDHREVWNQSIYEQLHRIAEKALKHEAPGHSLQPTLLVNDAYLRLLDQRNVTPEDRSAVMAAGANIIRRLLVDYARKRKRLKRGGENGRGNPLHFSIGDHANQIDVLELNDAMEVFAKERPRAAQVVELKFFGGLTGEVIAEQLGVSIRTVKNDWRLAKAWLYRELGADHDEIDARYESGMGAVVMAEKTTVTYKTQALLCSLCCLLVQTVLHGRSLMIRNHRQFQLAAATVAGFLFWLLAGFASGETWTDQSGKYQVDAKFVGVEGRSVVLRKIDGSTVEVPIDRLSAESRARAKRMYEMSKSGASVRGDAPQAAPTMSATATASSSHLSPNGLKLNFTPPDPPSVAPMPAFPENASLKETFDFVSGQVLSGHPEVLWYALPEEVRTTFDSEEMRIASLQSRKAEQATTDQMVGVVLKALEVLVTKKQFVLNSPFMTQVPPPAMPMIQQGYDPAVGTIFEVAMTLASATEEMEKMTITEILDQRGPRIGGHVQSLLKLAPPDMIDGFLSGVTIEQTSDTTGTISTRNREGGRENTEMVKLMGRWVPKNFADGWALSKDRLKVVLSAPEKDADTIQKNQIMAGTMATMASGVLDPMLAAGSQQEFDTAVMQVLAVMQMMASGGQTPAGF